MADASLARRYARALVELGQKNGNIDQLGADLARFEGLLDLGDAQLRKALENPGITIGQKRGVIDAVLAKTDYHPLVKNFIRLLIDKGRFGHVSLIAAAYRDMADGLAGRVRATVRYARELPPELRAEVQATLAAATGMQVVVTWGVDPALLGGLVAQVGDRVIDGSVRARLDAMQDALVRGVVAANA